jgi:hypothetical protein
MIDIFDDIPIDLTNLTCHSGGAVGSDSIWEEIGERYGVKILAYSYKTPYHTSPNKVEICDTDYKEGILEVNKANKWLNRFGISKYMNLLARNWVQVKYSDQIFAIGTIIKKGERNNKGYYNNGKYDTIDGGTGYCVQMAINNNKEVFVFDQIRDNWFRWSYNSMSFVLLKEIPKIQTQNFAGVGTRNILPNGVKAIKNIYENTFKNKIE